MSLPYSKDYTGKTVDISILRFASDDVPEGSLVLGYGSPQKVITGVEALKQTFLVLFFSELGSIFRDEGVGTEFGASVGAYSANIQAIQHRANIATARTLNIMLTDQVNSTQTIPDDEYIVDATVSDIESDSADHIRFKILVQTRAGTISTIFLPIPVGLSS